MDKLVILINVANLLYLASYSVRDILWLRILTVTGALCALPYFYLQPTPLMTPIYWSLIFMAINVYWIVQLLIERRPVQLAPDEQRLYQPAFRTLTPREAMNLIRLGTWLSTESGEFLAKRGEELGSLSIIFSGRAAAEANGRVVAEIGEGRFIGQISYFTENEPAVADVKTTEPTRLMTWPIEALLKVTKSNPELGFAIKIALGLDISHHLMESLKQETPG